MQEHQSEDWHALWACGGKCGRHGKPSLLPFWGHGESCLPHGQQQPEGQEPDEQACRPHGRQAGLALAVPHLSPPRAADGEGQGAHEDLLA